MPKRLESTRNIFNNKNATVIALVRKIDLQVAEDYKLLNHLRGSLLRSTRPETIKRISDTVSTTAVSMGLNPTTVVDKNKLLARITKYKRQNSFLQFASRNQAVIALCANFEDFIGRVIEKYFEEDPSRLSKYKQTVSSEFVIKIVQRGDNLHRTLSEKLAGDLMHGGVKEWYKQLKKLGMNTDMLPHTVHEAFLIRHCIVHNDRKVSSQLHAKNPNKYFLRKDIRLNVEDIDTMKKDLHSAMKYIFDEYNRLFPKQKGTWIDYTNKNEEVNFLK
jgi:hypothetical protein